MDHENQYKYDRIALSTDAIRLLRLLKGFPAEPIQCELFETFLHQMEGVPYKALSYAWGDSPVAYKISINDRRSLVKENLHMALLALRQTDEDRLLWIDAICIDQSNDKEKGHQVGQMRRIYECAQRVVVWLGPSNLEVDFLMNATAQWEYQTRQRPGAQHKQGWIDSWTRFTADETGLYKEEVAARRRNSLKEILDRPWFRRVWILQEVASAKKATVLCGSKAMSSQGFSLLPFLLKLEPDSHIEAVLDILPGFRRKESWWSEQQTLDTLLLKFGTSEASDHRDNIYALLGIASDVRASNTLLPDYEIPLGHAICHTISFLLFGEAYKPSARPLPNDMEFTTFLGILPRLSDYVLGWALPRNHDVTAAAVVPKLVDINTIYDMKDNTSAAVRLTPAWSPLTRILSSFNGFDHTLRAILERDDANVEGGNNAPILAVRQGRLDRFGLLLQYLSSRDVKLTLGSSETLLNCAAAYGDRGIFRRTVSIVISLDDPDSEFSIRSSSVIRWTSSDNQAILVHAWLFDYLKSREGHLETDSFDDYMNSLFETLAILQNNYRYVPKSYLMVLLVWEHREKRESLSFEPIKPIALDGPRPEPSKSMAIHVLIDGKELKPAPREVDPSDLLLLRYFTHD